MDKFIKFSRFLEYFFDGEKQARQAARIVKGLDEQETTASGTDDCSFTAGVCGRSLVRRSAAGCCEGGCIYFGDLIYGNVRSFARMSELSIDIGFA
jgi:hypothetical protein